MTNKGCNPHSYQTCFFVLDSQSFFTSFVEYKEYALFFILCKQKKPPEINQGVKLAWQASKPSLGGNHSVKVLLMLQQLQTIKEHIQ